MFQRFTLQTATRTRVRPVQRLRNTTLPPGVLALEDSAELLFTHLRVWAKAEVSTGSVPASLEACPPRAGKCPFLYKGVTLVGRGPTSSLRTVYWLPRVITALATGVTKDRRVHRQNSFYLGTDHFTDASSARQHGWTTKMS